MHTTQPQLQRVSQWNWSFACKEAVLPACFFLGSSLVAQFHKASVKFLRTTSLACIRLNRNYNESAKWNGSFACKEAVLPACFVFPRASACLILACLSTVFCRPATCFGMFDFGMFKFGPLHAKMRSFRHVSSFRVLRHVWFWHV